MQNGKINFFFLVFWVFFFLVFGGRFQFRLSIIGWLRVQQKQLRKAVSKFRFALHWSLPDFKGLHLCWILHFFISSFLHYVVKYVCEMELAHVCARRTVISSVSFFSWIDCGHWCLHAFAQSWWYFFFFFFFFPHDHSQFSS